MYSVGIHVLYVAYDGPDSAEKNWIERWECAQSSFLFTRSIYSYFFLPPQRILIKEFKGPSSFYVAYIS